MLKKFLVSVVFTTLLFSQTMFYAAPQTAEESEMLRLAAMLPDSDIVATIDGERIASVAAPSLLGNDLKKIEHLNNLMRTIENQIGLNPLEIKQIAFGLKLPATVNSNPADALLKSEFAAIVRTANPNGNLLDTWSKRIDAIMAFKEEQAPSRKLMDDFKRYRDFKPERAAPEKVATAIQKFDESLKKTQAIGKALDALPKLTTDAGAAANLRTANKELAETINEYLKLLKSDTDTKNLRETSIKLLNRWNAVTIDDAQRAAKLNAILTEAKNIAPAYKQKYENARRMETLFEQIENAPTFDMANPVALSDELNAELDKTLVALSALPPTKAKRTIELNSLADTLKNVNMNLNDKLVALNPMPESEMVGEQTIPAPTKPKSFYLAIKMAQREEKINGKRMLVIDTAKMDEMPPPEKPTEAAEKNTEDPQFAIGFVDEKTMVIGFERTVKPFLQRDASYKNQKAVEMLGNAKNSLTAFAVNANAIKTITAGAAKSGEQPAGTDVFGSAIFNRFVSDINIYGSVNYDAGSVTNDITMSLGFFKDTVMGDALQPESKAADNQNVDNTFEIAGYQVGKDIFYDLFNSFKAVQASLTFKFEKKKVAALIRSTPRIIERIKTANSTAKKETANSAKTKSAKLESLQDLLTAPQLYIDLAGLLKGKG